MIVLERAILLFLILMYTSGAIGMWINPQAFIPYTPVVMLIFAGYFSYVHRFESAGFFITLIGIGVLSFAIEAIGVNTGYVFGNYHYGTAFGTAFLGVPLAIGLNWIVVLTACWGVFSFYKLPLMVHCALSATLCTFIDMLMEPLAPQFNWWFFSEGFAGPYNYLSWFLWSFILGYVFKTALFQVKFRAAGHWLLLNIIYFLILNIKRFVI